MSRCFPFPPPGYEKKRKAENLDLLTKEKRKEKKHKKEKKDREKREHREKRDKDRSKEKHRDKKDRKERHNKHRKKGKDNNSCRAEAHSAPKVVDDPNDSNLVVELGRRTGDDAAANQIAAPSPIGKFDRPAVALVASSQEKERVPEKKTLPVHILASPDPTRNHGLSRSAQAFPTPVERGKIGANAAPLSQRKNDVLVFSSEIALPPSRPRAAVSEIFRNPPPAISDHRKIPSVFQPGKGKNAGDMVVAAAAAAAAAKTEESEGDACRSFGKLSSSKPLAPHKSIAAGIIRSAVDETTKSGASRKINGFLQESDAGFINKIPRAGPPSQLPPPASGRPPNPHLFAPSKDADRTTPLERRMNGIAKPPHPPCEMRPPPAENGVLPSKPPHPDSKFLDRVYAVPKVDPFSELGDDQGWLLSERREEKRGSEKRLPPPIQVWAEAVRIDSADCFALPYVVPY